MDSMKLSDLTSDYRIDVYCSRGHTAVLRQPDLIQTCPGDVLIGTIAKNLRCRACNQKGPSIRIVYVGAGEFSYQNTTDSILEESQT